MYKISETVRATHGQDGAVVLDIQQGRVLRFNTTASLIFQRLERGEAPVEIIEAISQSFSIPPEIARTDVLDFVKSMVEEGLVQTTTSLEH
jgi:Coenzyme PQQ synthesis protein D (PqqD)